MNERVLDNQAMSSESVKCLMRWARYPVDAWVLPGEDHQPPGPSFLTHGIPVGVKDIIDVAGRPTRGGSKHTSDECAREDAPIVARLRRAGVRILGKTATCQFACFDPAPTLNPWNPERTPGGSSAGSAAAVAVKQCRIALGTQTGGSIIRPASYCGVCGFKPAHDPQWLVGVLPVSARLDHVGPLARSVADLELVWRVIVDEPERITKIEPPRLGVLRDYFWEHASKPVRTVTGAALDRLIAAGASVHDVPLPPHWQHVHAAHRTIMAFDCARQHVSRFSLAPYEYLPQISALIREGLAIQPEAYNEAVALQATFTRDLLAAYPDVDALVMPATTTTAPTRETTGDARFNVPWSLAGVPAVTLPCGLATDGMPCGLQLVRPHGKTHADEFALLAIAAWCEAALDVDLWPELERRLKAQFPETAWADQYL
jgi:Asp-tRNA(Asn)/Glu-tRNA(Gln) amidotransferase A subunit family amidase